MRFARVDDFPDEQLLAAQFGVSGTQALWGRRSKRRRRRNRKRRWLERGLGGGGREGGWRVALSIVFDFGKLEQTYRLPF